MHVQSLKMKPWKIGSTLGMGIRFQAASGETFSAFLPPIPLGFLKQQFVAIDERFAVWRNPAKFEKRMTEFVRVREGLRDPEIDAHAVIRDLGVDETGIPVVLTTVNVRAASFILRFDEIAVHGVVAEILDNELAFAGVHGRG